MESPSPVQSSNSRPVESNTPVDGPYQSVVDTPFMDIANQAFLQRNATLNAKEDGIVDALVRALTPLGEPAGSGLIIDVTSAPGMPAASAPLYRDLGKCSFCPELQSISPTVNFQAYDSRIRITFLAEHLLTLTSLSIPWCPPEAQECDPGYKELLDRKLASKARLDIVTKAIKEYATYLVKSIVMSVSSSVAVNEFVDIMMKENYAWLVNIFSRPGIVCRFTKDSKTFRFYLAEK